ncbi:MAG: iron-sulfur cluster insertion protein ErpA [Gammaproteobacteria bacterium]|nr:iron-sulfur cluster insertion protein ErpA [Gammaproteobacteria bacterium]
MDVTVTDDIIFTDNAAAKAKQLRARQGRDEMALRVYIEGGGCSGFQYVFDFEDGVEEDDMIFENDGVKLLIDPLSYQYLSGSTVDYKEDLSGAQFIIVNPNAKSTCGCGMSFGV